MPNSRTAESSYSVPSAPSPRRIAIHQKLVFILIGVLLVIALWACQPSQTAPGGVLHIEIAADAQPATRLVITETLDGKPASQGLMHALIIPADMSTLYHEHPQELSTGHFALDVPALPTGEYDIWIEITIGSGHADAILNRFTMQLQGPAPATNTVAGQATLEPTKLNIESPGSLSHLEFLIALDGKPVQRFGQFKGVQVHSFAVSTDREWFRHDHADAMGKGIVDAHYHFPKAGQYVILLQPTITTEAGREIRPILRHTVTVP